MKDGFVLRADDIIDKMSRDCDKTVPEGRLRDWKRPLVGDAMSWADAAGEERTESRHGAAWLANGERLC